MSTTRVLRTAAGTAIAAAIVMTGSLTMVTSTSADTAPTDAAPIVGEATPTAPYDQPMVDWARGLFQEAGLDLADVEIRTVAVLAVALGTPAQPSTAAVELPAPVFAIEQDATAYEWTQDLFSTAGFEQPAVTIEFFDNEEPCGGVRGRAWFSDEATTIAVCATHDNPEVQEQWRQRTLLHETAHAWIDQNVSPENLDAFTELRGLETWSSREVAWEQRATEHAAEIFMWGIQDGDYNVDFRIDDTSCNELAAGYELLTGISVDCAATS